MKIFLVLSSVLLVGCSGMGDYYKTIAAANQQIAAAEQAKAQAEQAKIGALMRIAQTGDPTSQVAAVMALAFVSQGQGSGAKMMQPQAPPDRFYQVASIAIPSLTQILSLKYSKDVAINTSNNARDVQINTNGTFGVFASEIGKPPLVVDREVPFVVPQQEPFVIQPVFYPPVTTP